MSSPTLPWQPPSDHLEHRGGVWQARQASAVSYPDHGNHLCFQVEDSSYWFAHRNECLLETMRQFPPAGRLYDIGGGNGFLTAAMERAGHEMVLVEPGPGALNAASRGVRHVVKSTLADAAFHPASLPAAAAFDVIEHIQDDLDFLCTLRQLLQPGGRFYCTVPALNLLWSGEDVQAGHFRRYSQKTLTDVLQRAGFVVEFKSYLFAWLTLPVLMLRALPSRLKMPLASKPGTADSTRKDHRLPAALAAPVRALHQWELSRLKRRQPVPFGTSLLCVARAIP